MGCRKFAEFLSSCFDFWSRIKIGSWKPSFAIYTRLQKASTARSRSTRAEPRQEKPQLGSAGRGSVCPVSESYKIPFSFGESFMLINHQHSLMILFKNWKTMELRIEITLKILRWLGEGPGIIGKQRRTEYEYPYLLSVELINFMAAINYWMVRMSNA